MYANVLSFLTKRPEHERPALYVRCCYLLWANVLALCYRVVGNNLDRITLIVD